MGACCLKQGTFAPFMTFGYHSIPLLGLWLFCWTSLVYLKNKTFLYPLKPEVCVLFFGRMLFIDLLSQGLFLNAYCEILRKILDNCFKTFDSLYKRFGWTSIGKFRRKVYMGVISFFCRLTSIGLESEKRMGPFFRL